MILTLDPTPDVHVTDTIREALAVAKKLDVEVSFDFNGHTFFLCDGDDPDAAYRKYMESFDRAPEPYEPTAQELADHAAFMEERKRLHDAAEEMLEALEAARSALDGSSAFAGVKAKINAAIAKAEGQ